MKKASAVATITMATEDIRGLFNIITDYNDLSNSSSSDVKLVIKSFNPFSDLSFSDASIKWGTENINSRGQLIKQDMVRHISKDVTGAYATAKIFTNKNILVEDIITVNNQLQNDISNSIDALFEDSSGGNVNFETGLNKNTPLNRVYSSIQSLYVITMESAMYTNDDARSIRYTNFLSDLNNYGVACDQYGNTSDLSHVNINEYIEGDVSGARYVKTPLTFIPGDALAMTIEYQPKTIKPLGNNNIKNKIYKVLIELV